MAETAVFFSTHFTGEQFVNKGSENIQPATAEDLSHYLVINKFQYIGLLSYI